MKQSPIFTRTYDLLLWLIPKTTKFSREQRFVLAKAVQETALRFQETLIEAALSNGRGEQRALARADVDLAKLRFYLRLCEVASRTSPRWRGQSLACERPASFAGKIQNGPAAGGSRKTRPAAGLCLFRGRVWFDTEWAFAQALDVKYNSV